MSRFFHRAGPFQGSCGRLRQSPVMSFLVVMGKIGWGRGVRSLTVVRLRFFEDEFHMKWNLLSLDGIAGLLILSFGFVFPLDGNSPSASETPWPLLCCWGMLRQAQRCRGGAEKPTDQPDGLMSDYDGLCTQHGAWNCIYGWDFDSWCFGRCLLMFYWKPKTSQNIRQQTHPLIIVW